MSLLKANAVQLGQSVTATNNFTWYQPSSPDGTVRLGNGNSGSVTDLVTLTSAGNLGIGTSSPGYNLQVTSTGGTAISATDITSGSASYAGFRADTQSSSGFFLQGNASLGVYAGANSLNIINTAAGPIAFFNSSGTERMRLDSSGNLGLGVTPSAWGASTKAVEIGASSSVSNVGTTTGITVGANVYNNSGWKYKLSAERSTLYEQYNGAHQWFTAPSGTAGNAISFTQAMTLDASGNLLVGATTSSYHTFWKNVSDGVQQYEIGKSSGVPTVRFYATNAATDPNAAATCQAIWRNPTNSRSINAAGTVNASGADYAEYMVKAGTFEIAKGNICGIDSSGLLTNVFSNAVSFVVKSTDPSYVGNDSWGVGIEDQDALEAERQKVDRIAFAGQVPVNVFGAKAGDYIIPVVDADGIKGEAIANPTFEQYKIAVGKVIAIETDGRAKIIVKVA